MNQYKKVAFYTLGCKLNFSETSTISRGFEQGGYAKVKFEEQADVYVINTCSVTENADKKCRAIVRKAKRNNPASFVAIIGCYAQLKPNEISEIDGVDLVLGANEKFNILEHVASKERNETNEKVFSTDIDKVERFVPSYSIGDRTRTFLKVQDGCDYNCSFCTIPLARGKSRSNSIAQTMEVANQVSYTTCKEIVLTGVNIGDFGTKNGESFLGLVQELENLQGRVERIRISSIEPNLLSEDIISFVAKSKKFVPHFHVPLQSGSPEILKNMRRRYKRDLYTQRVCEIKKQLPLCCIGVDVIVGFPGETDEHFRETYDYLQELPVSYFHVFTYSERDNTIAKDFDTVVPKQKRAERSKMLQILSSKKRRQFYQENINAEYPVLWESEEDELGYMFGFTPNYIKVKKKFDSTFINKTETIILKQIDKDGIFITN